MSTNNQKNIKANVEIFDNDAREHGGYLYSVGDGLSKNFSTSRSTRGIAESINLVGKTVLDIGCGDGISTMELIELGASSVLGMEPAPSAVERANAEARKRNLPNISFEVGNIYDLRKDLPVFDIVMLRGVLHHLSDPAKAILSIAPYGKNFVILEPNGMNPVLKVIENVSPYHIAHEEQSFLPSKVESWIDAAGGVVQYRKYINLVPIFCPDWLAKILKVLEPLVEATPALRAISMGQYVMSGKFELNHPERT
jgi:SAM-dependent methyltransferase